MDELPAYSWHGSDHRSVERKGWHTHTHTRIPILMGWVVGTRGFLYIGRQLGGSFVGSSLDFCRYARCTPVYCSAGIGGRAKQIFGAKPLKTRDQPTDELICFPCDAAFFVFFLSFFFFFFSFLFLFHFNNPWLLLLLDTPASYGLFWNDQSLARAIFRTRFDTNMSVNIGSILRISSSFRWMDSKSFYFYDQLTLVSIHSLSILCFECFSCTFEFIEMRLKSARWERLFHQLLDALI